MHHNRSLLSDVEVLLGVMVKTSRCSTKLLFVILNFYSWFFCHNFDQIWDFLNIRIFTKFLNFNQISELWPAQISKSFEKQFHWPRHFKNVKKGGSREHVRLSHFYDPEVRMLLRSFALKGNDDLIWTLPLNYDQTRKPQSPPTTPPTNRDVKHRATSAAKEWKFAMANFKITAQKWIINLTQFEETSWAKHNKQWQSNKWKIITFVWRMPM